MNSTEHNQKIVEQFSKQARGYTGIKSHSDALQKLIKMSNVGKDDIVLDIACGSGIVSCAFAEYAKHVTGIDMTKEMLKEARKKQEVGGFSNLQWDLGLVEQLPYENGQFSIVVSRFGFHHFLDPGKVLSEMMRVCKRGGVILVVDVSLPDHYIDCYNAMESIRDDSHVAALSISQFQELFKNVGIESLKHDTYTMVISLKEQLKASFPTDATTFRKMVIDDIGQNKLGVQVTQKKEGVYLYYPIHIFAMVRGK